MYTILVNNDNTLYGSQKERIMQRSKLVNTLRFIVEPIYNDIDMTTASFPLLSKGLFQASLHYQNMFYLCLVSIKLLISF